MIRTGQLIGTALVAVLTLGLLLTPCPAAADAQQARGLDDPRFVGKWDFEKSGNFGQWKPLQAVGVFELKDGMVLVTAKSQRPCLDLIIPHAANEIDSIEIRLRAIPVERDIQSGTPSDTVGGAGNRTRINSQLYQGTRLYFTTSAGERFNPEHSIEFKTVYDNAYHVLTITPHEHPSWKGMIRKIRLDVGDFPNHYELDYIYFHRAGSPVKEGANSTESEKK